MKKIDLYIIKSFLKPFFATFFVILFVLIMVALWSMFDKITGKSVGILFILKFIWYLTLTVVPMALPIGVLLSSIMTIGDLAEHYEYAAIKSAGVSLKRFMQPLIVFTLLLSSVNFLFLNYVYPHATLKQRNMLNNVRKKQPALALIPGTFNTDIPGYVIKFEEKYGEEQNLLRKVQISDVSKNLGKLKVITAERGEITSENGSKYMTFKLYDGHYYEEHATKRHEMNKRKKMPASKATFDSYAINVDISAFSGGNLEDTGYKSHHEMLSLSQLNQFSDSTKQNYNEYLRDRNKNIMVTYKVDRLKEESDSTYYSKYEPEILDNFDLDNKEAILQASLRSIDRKVKNADRNTDTFKRRRKTLNLYDHQFHHRLASSLACLVLFFIGAPLGSIIKKGGLGLPMILAIIIFVVYFLIGNIGKNVSEESGMPSYLGGWLSTLIMLPFGFLITSRAAKDKGIIFNVKFIAIAIKGIFSKFKFKKDQISTNE